MSTRRLSAARRRHRREQLARRHGARCTYCLRPFTATREPTIDHIVPHSLFPTWSVGHLTLACRPCNHAKANRLPLSLALLLLRRYGPPQPTGTAVNTTLVHGAPTVFTAPITPAPALLTDRKTGQVTPGRATVNSHPTAASSPVALWLLLARIAHAREAATTAREQPRGHREHSVGRREQTRERRERPVGFPARASPRPPATAPAGRPDRPKPALLPRTARPETRSHQRP
ncbi:HNH endonuclease [Streptomyces sp. NPDC091387]|uniref:HNH endonuclease n=1 Tax=Streptomyces sp. NPDC091387 TaxID=3365998 RepID=UPI0038006077